MTFLNSEHLKDFLFEEILDIIYLYYFKILKFKF